MSPKDVIRLSLDMSDTIINAYIGDLADADLLIRAVPGMNHIAWQLGHIINGEQHFLNLIQPGSSPSLPDDFEEGHAKDKSGLDDPSKFYSRSKYQEMWKAQRTATRLVLDGLPEERLDEADPQKFPDYASSVAALFSLIGNHPLMHCGQFVAVRRKLGKPVLI